MIAFERLDPATLGKLIAAYEHRVYVESRLFGINPFDQWGVELGKKMAVQLAPALSDEAAPDLSAVDSSTASLVRRYRTMRGRA